MSFCQCGQQAHPLYNGRCEDCYVEGLVKVHGARYVPGDHGTIAGNPLLIYRGESPFTPAGMVLLKPTLCFRRSVKHVHDGG